MEATPIESHMRTALRMRVLRDVELDEARRWCAVFGRATDDQAREFLRRTIEPHVAAARKFNRQMIKAQRGIRSELAARMRSMFTTGRGADGRNEMDAGAPAQVRGDDQEEKRFRTIERAPAIVDGLVAIVLGKRTRGAVDDGGRAVDAESRGSASSDRGGGDSRRRRQASRLIAFLCAIGAGGGASGCSVLGATPWSELSTGERIVNVVTIVGLAAYVAHASGGHSTYVGTGGGPEPCAVGDPCSNPSPGVPCMTAASDPVQLPPGCIRN